MEFQFIIYCIYGIPSAILNLLLIICIFKSKTLLQASFYRVYLFVLCVYLFTYINTYPTVKLPALRALAPFFADVEDTFPPFRVFFMFQVAAFHIQNMSLLLMHLNRFTSVLMPFSHHRIWKNRNINCVCFLIVLVGNSLCYQYLFYTGKIFMEFNGYIVQGPAAAAQTAFAISTVPVMSFVYPFASLGINIVIFFALLHLRWKRKSKKAMGTIEWNLFLICLFTLIIQFLLMLFLRYAYKIFDLSTVAFGLNLVSDFSTLSETFIGLALNTTMRGEMIRMLIKSTSFRKIFQGSSTRQETSSLKVTAW